MTSRFSLLSLFFSGLREGVGMFRCRSDGSDFNQPSSFGCLGCAVYLDVFAVNDPPRILKPG